MLNGHIFAAEPPSRSQIRELFSTCLSAIYRNTIYKFPTCIPSTCIYRMTNLHLGHPQKRENQLNGKTLTYKQYKSYLNEGKIQLREQHQPKMTKTIGPWRKERKRHLPVWHCVLENSTTWIAWTKHVIIWLNPLLMT